MSTYQILINDQPVPALPLLGLTIDQEVGRIPRASLEIIDGDVADQDFAWSSGTWFDPGNAVAIQLGEAEELQTIFQGIVVQQNITISNDGQAMLTVTCQDKAYRMTLDRKSRFYQTQQGTDQVGTMTDEDIFQVLADEPDYDLQIEADPLPSPGYQAVEHENMWQHSASDWDFLLLRAEATGRLCVVEPGTIRLLIPDMSQAPALTLTFGDNLLAFEADLDGRVQAEQTTVTSWDIDRQTGQQETTTTVTGADRAGEVTAQKLATTTGTAQQAIHYGGDLQVAEARLLGYAQMQRQALGKIRGTGKVEGTAAVSPGKVVQLDGLGKKWNGRAFVSGVRHEFMEGRWHTHVQLGLSPRPHAARYPVHTPPAAHMLPAVQGLMYGTVVGYPQSTGGYELIEVAIDAATASAETPPTLYARLANFYAGHKGGAVFRPEVGDEVVLGFVEGDPRFAVLLGALYNSQHTPHWGLSADGVPQQKGIFVNPDAQGKGWEIAFDEEKETLTVASPKGQTIVLDDQKATMRLEDSHDNTFTMDQTGIHLNSAKGEITLQAGKDVKVDSKKNVQATAKAKLSLSGIALEQNSKSSIRIKGQIVEVN